MCVQNYFIMDIIGGLDEIGDKTSDLFTFIKANKNPISIDELQAMSDLEAAYNDLRIAVENACT